MAGDPTGWTGNTSSSGPGSDWTPDPEPPPPSPELPNILRGEQGEQGVQGEQGEVGPPGPRGAPGGRIFKQAPAALSAGLAVYALADGEHIGAASATVAAQAHAIMGVSVTSAGALGGEVEIARFGELEDESFSFIPQRNVFVGIDGQLTQTFDPAWSYVRVVGVAITATKLLVDLRPPTFVAH